MQNECPFTDAHTHCRISSGGAICIVNLPDGSTAVPSDAGADTLFSAEIHPWNTDESSDADVLIARLQNTLKNVNCAAVGECGLDTLRGAPMSVQKEIFERAAALSCELGLPLIIHCVRAWDDIISIRREMSDGRQISAWVIHGFRGSEKLAFDLISKGFILSFGAPLMKNEMPFFAKLPDSSFLLETDDSKLKIEDIYSAAASIRGTDIFTLKNTVFNTFKKIFLKG